MRSANTRRASSSASAGKRVVSASAPGGAPSDAYFCSQGPDCVAGHVGLELGNVALGQTSWFCRTFSYQRGCPRTAKADDRRARVPVLPTRTGLLRRGRFFLSAKEGPINIAPVGALGRLHGCMKKPAPFRCADDSSIILHRESDGSLSRQHPLRQTGEMRKLVHDIGAAASKTSLRPS